ncbi:MAG: response regulator [Pseudomonadales bacterium]|nr:response regulator [Pseudomonadales bacterium]
MYPTLALILFFLLCFISIIDELRIRQLERRHQQAKKNISEQSRFIAVLCHEIRNPITGMVSVLRMLGKTSLNEQQRQLLDTADQSSRELLHLLDDTLDQERTHASEDPLQYEDIVLVDLIQPLLTRYRHLARQKGLMLITSIDTAATTTVHSDSGKIRQILNNLLINAIKFTDSGIIKLHIEQESTASDNALCFRVIDSGRGIPASAQNKIFAAYTQVEHTQPHPGGTGLGLHISRTLAQALGGDLHVDSAEGRGSIFSFKLPLSDKHAQHHNTPVPSQYKLHILVIDDSEIHRLATCALLTALGHSVATAASVSDATPLLQWQQFDSVFIDMHLPDLSGIHAIRHIRSLQKPRQQPTYVIAVSAWLTHNDIQTLLGHGADAACTKPLNQQSLAQLLTVARTQNTEKSAQPLSTTLPPHRSARIS